MHRHKTPPKPNPLVRLYEPPAESEPDMALIRSFAVVVLPGLPAAVESVPDGGSQQADAAAQDFALDHEVSDECDEAALIEIDAAHLPVFQRLIRERNELGRELAETKAELRTAREVNSRPPIYRFTAKFIDQALRAADAIRATAEHSSGDTDRLAYLEVGELVRAADEYRSQLQKASVQA